MNPQAPNPQNPLSQTSDTKTQPPKDNHWITIAAMAVFVLLSLAAVVFLYYQNQKLKSMLADYQSTLPPEIPSPTATTNATTSATINITGTLQDYLLAECVPGNTPSIELGKLPLNIDLSSTGLKVKRIFCSSAEDPSKPIKNGYLALELSNNQSIYIFDDKSEELGHGGAPFLGLVGPKIYDKNGIKIGAWIQGGDAVQVLGDVGINMKGSKEFSSKSGSAIFINYGNRAIPGNDQRLIDQLTPYSAVDPSAGVEEPLVNYSESMTTKVINFFFAKEPAATTPEGKMMQEIIKVLSGITAK